MYLKYKTVSKLLLTTAVFQLLGVWDPPVYAFGGAGPYTHIRISYEALDRFSQESGWEVSGHCAEVIAQGSVVSDSAANMSNYTLHCDNNDLAGCSYRLDQFKQEANRAIILDDSLMRMGQALHIVQDFYSHSNWVEIFGFSMNPAPLEHFKDVPPPVDLQSGLYPDLFWDVEAQVACMFLTPEHWPHYIYGATHACLNKDSNATQRGLAFVPDGYGVTYHELAAQYAINHSVQLLKYYAAHNPNFSLCFHKLNFLKGCNMSVNNRLR